IFFILFLHFTTSTLQEIQRLFGTLRKPTKPFDTLQEHISAISKFQEHKFLQGFVSFIFSFHVFCFCFFVLFLLIYFILTLCENLRRFLNCKITNSYFKEIEIWSFVYFFI